MNEINQTQSKFPYTVLTLDKLEEVVNELDLSYLNSIIRIEVSPKYFEEIKKTFKSNGMKAPKSENITIKGTELRVNKQTRTYRFIYGSGKVMEYNPDTNNMVRIGKKK